MKTPRDWYEIAERMQDRDELLTALEWLVHLAHGVSKSGGKPTDDEWEDALNSAEKAIAKAKMNSTDD